MNTLTKSWRKDHTKRSKGSEPIEEEVYSTPHRYRRFFYLMCAFGYFPPLMEALRPTKWLKVYAYLLNTSLQCLNLVHHSLISRHIIITSLPKILLLSLSRRNLVMYQFSFLMYYLTFRRKHLGRLLHVWTDNSLLVGDKSDLAKRQVLFEENIRKTIISWSLSFLIYVGVPQMYNIIFIFNPYAKGAQFVICPHSVHSPFHKTLIGLSTFMYFMSFATFFYTILCMFLLNMLLCQLKYLQSQLGDIYGSTSVKGENEVAEYNTAETSESAYYLMLMKKKLKFSKWMVAHNRTIQWGKDINTYLGPLLTVKFLYLSLYAAFMVYTIPHYVRTGQINDVMLNLGYSYGLFSMQFFLTRIMDEIAEVSSSLTLETYEPELFDHPLPMLRSIRTVSTYTINNPIRFKGLFIFYDNTGSFLKILELAYRGLSVLLQMDV